MEMEIFYGEAREEDQGALAFKTGSGKGLSSVLASLWFGPAQRISASKEDPAGAVRVLRAPEACTARRMCGRPAHDYHGDPARVQVELFAFAHCIAGCIE